MKFKCNQQTLSKALNTVSKAVSTRTTIPILKGILLHTEADGTLTLSASDLDLSIEKKIEVEVEEEGSTVVSSKLFVDIIRKLPNEEITIEEKENSQVSIKTSFSEFTVVGLSPDEFPVISDIEEEKSEITFENNLLKDMIRKTVFAAGTDETKGVIVGVLFEIEEESIQAVALDGFRLAFAKEQMKNEKSSKMIITAKILNEIYKIISETDQEEDISIAISNKKAIVMIDDTKIVLRLLEGEFIKYKDIIPKEKNTTVEIERTVLLESIERASLLAKEGKNNLIKFTIKNNLLTITSRSDDGNVKEEIIMEKTGEDIEIGFNSKYMIDVLKAIDDDFVKMEFNNQITPCIIKPTEGDQYQYLVLPVRISSNY